MNTGPRRAAHPTPFSRVTRLRPALTRFEAAFGADVVRYVSVRSESGGGRAHGRRPQARCLHRPARRSPPDAPQGPREGGGEIQAGCIPGRAPQIAGPVVAAAVLDLAQHILARDAGGRAAGVSCHVGYVNNQGDVVSLAMLGHEHTELGTELILTWGEPNGGARKPQVEQHEQSQIRVTVAPAPCKGSVLRRSIALRWATCARPAGRAGARRPRR
jgi:hypothetical protein